MSCHYAIVVEEGGIILTTNQLKYWAQVEEARHNKATEEEANRSNLAREAENIKVRQSNERLKKYDVDQRTATSKYSTDVTAATARAERNLKQALKTQEGKQKVTELILKDPTAAATLHDLRDSAGRYLTDPNFDIGSVSDVSIIVAALGDTATDFIKQVL